MRKWLILLLMLGVLAGGLLSWFYRWFDYTAHRLAEAGHLPPAMANGIKHSYAAAETYAVLRSMGSGPETAESLVLALGILNEYAESYFRDPPDSTAEVIKDMHNNYVGITVARLHEEQPGKGRRLELILFLARAGIVVAQPDEVVGTEVATRAVPDVAYANRWLRTHRAVISQNVEDAF